MIRDMSLSSLLKLQCKLKYKNRLFLSGWDVMVRYVSTRLVIEIDFFFKTPFTLPHIACFSDEQRTEGPGHYNL